MTPGLKPDLLSSFIAESVWKCNQHPWFLHMKNDPSYRGEGTMQFEPHQSEQVDQSGPRLLNHTSLTSRVSKRALPIVKVCFDCA